MYLRARKTSERVRVQHTSTTAKLSSATSAPTPNTTMQFKIISSLAALSAALLAVPAMAQTVTYQGYASTVSCTGSAFGCSDNGAVCEEWLAMACRLRSRSSSERGSTSASFQGMSSPSTSDQSHPQIG